MSEPIKVGDLVMVLRGCCVNRDTFIGEIRRVDDRFTSGGRCFQCGADYSGEPGAVLDGIDVTTFHVSWLKRIPPLSELESEKTKEELTA